MLDTCTFLWIGGDAPELSDKARELFQNPENEVYLSCVSAWEIAVKNALGRLPLPERPDTYVPKLRQLHAIEPLPLDEEATLHLTTLPSLHKDPFDRMLVCQAIVSGLVLLTPDELVTQYPTRSTW